MLNSIRVRYSPNGLFESPFDDDLADGTSYGAGMTDGGGNEGGRSTGTGCDYVTSRGLTYGSGVTKLKTESGLTNGSGTWSSVRYLEVPQ